MWFLVCSYIHLYMYTNSEINVRHFFGSCGRIFCLNSISYCNTNCYVDQNVGQEAAKIDFLTEIAGCELLRYKDSTEYTKRTASSWYYYKNKSIRSFLSPYLNNMVLCCYVRYCGSVSGMRIEIFLSVVPIASLRKEENIRCSHFCRCI
jgi:hypothetical protein